MHGLLDFRQCSFNGAQPLAVLLSHTSFLLRERLLTHSLLLFASTLLRQIDSDPSTDQFPRGEADIPEHQQAVDAQGVVDVGGPPVCERICTRCA